MVKKTTIRKVRLCAYPVHWLADSDTFDDNTEIVWSTGETTKPGDIQVFAVSKTMDDAPEAFADDPRRDAVHSIWEAQSEPLEEYEQYEWSVQAEFKLLVRLEIPVPKGDLVEAGIILEYWPENYRGKFLHTHQEIQKLAEVLAKKNAKQRKEIFSALGL